MSDLEKNNNEYLIEQQKRTEGRYFSAGSPQWLSSTVAEEIEYVSKLLRECLKAHDSQDLKDHYTDLINELDYRLNAL